jgi:zinc protease
MRTLLTTFTVTAFILIGTLAGFAQDAPPVPAAPKTVNVPPVQEKKLRNGLTVAVVERRNVPLVTVQLMIKSGANYEAENKAGLADLTASMLTKGTTTRTATQIAEAVEFLGGTISNSAGWNNSFVSITVTSDKVDRAVAILQDLILNPKFDEKEMDLLKAQTLDGLTYNLKQPSFIANYVATKFSFNEHPAGGTPDSIKDISRADVADYHRQNYVPRNAVLVFTGNITAIKASALAATAFSGWKDRSSTPSPVVRELQGSRDRDRLVDRILVVDLPNSGQAAVSYFRPVFTVGRSGEKYFPAIVLNSVLGGGYSSRLNYEIRIKRGLSYGAGSSFAWRSGNSNFSTRAQTKNESAAEVAELVSGELQRIGNSSVEKDELVPRKSVLTGNFGRNLETTAGLAGALSELYSFGIPTSELNSYMQRVNAVTDVQIKAFGSSELSGGDVIIVGDYAMFKDDLAKRFAGMTIDVIKAADLDITKPGLHK